MKKLLVIAILMLALVFTVVACNDDPVVDETTADTTVAENPTEAPTAEPTDEPTKKGGCGSAISFGMVSVFAAAAVVALKKKED